EVVFSAFCVSRAAIRRFRVVTSPVRDCRCHLGFGPRLNRLPAQTGEDRAGETPSTVRTSRNPGGVALRRQGIKRRLCASSAELADRVMGGMSQPAAAVPGPRPPTGESNPVDRAAKKEAVTELNGVFKASNVVVVAHYAGLTVAQMQTLRKQARAAGATVKVAKNRLAKIALEGTDVASVAALLNGPTAIAYSGHPAAVPKVATDCGRAND